MLRVGKTNICRGVPMGRSVLIIEQLDSSSSDHDADLNEIAPALEYQHYPFPRRAQSMMSKLGAWLDDSIIILPKVRTPGTRVTKRLE